jgi:hypothetical protein
MILRLLCETQCVKMRGQLPLLPDSNACLTNKIKKVYAIPAKGFMFSSTMNGTNFHEERAIARLL